MRLIVVLGCMLFLISRGNSIDGSIRRFLHIRGGDSVNKGSRKWWNLTVGGGKDKSHKKENIEKKDNANRGGTKEEARGEHADGSPVGFLDLMIAFLEEPKTDMVVGSLSIVLVCFEMSKEIRKFGASGANWALLSVVIARFMKALLGVLKSTKQALRGYKKYEVVKLNKRFRRGKEVISLKELPPEENESYATVYDKAGNEESLDIDIDIDIDI